MKIALVLESFHPQGGGLEQWAWKLAHALSDRGHRVAVLTFHSTNERLPAGITVQTLPWQDSRLARADAVDAVLTEIDSDVVHDLGVGCSSDVLQPLMGCRIANYRRELLSLSRSRQVWRMIHPRKRRWLREVQELERRQYRRNSCVVVAVSRLVARDLSDAYDVPRERIRIIPNGVEPWPTEVDHEQRADKVLFLFAALNPRLKGLQPLLTAFAEAIRQRPELRLLVIGKEASPESLRFVRKNHLEHAVDFAGFVADARPYFAAADAFVLPTYYDACSLSILEACAAGLPVITTRQNGASELLTDGCEGRILGHAGDVPALRDALIELADPEVRGKIRSKALELASRCTFERNVDELEKLYSEILKRPQQARRTG